MVQDAFTLARADRDAAATDANEARGRPRSALVTEGGEGFMNHGERFLADHRDRRNLTDHTVREYRGRIRVLDEHGVTLENLNPRTLREVGDERGWGQSTRCTYFALASCLTDWAWKQRLIEVDPFDGVKAPTPPDPDPNPVSWDDFARLVELGRERAQRRTKPLDEWCILGAYAGLRCCEIAKVERADLRSGPDGYTLTVTGKGGIRASIPAHPAVVKIFEGKPAGPLYPGVTVATVHEAGRRLMRKAGLTGGFHRLRHLYATSIYQATGDPFMTKDLCRHKSLQSTLSYAKLADSKRHSVIAGLG